MDSSRVLAVIPARYSSTRFPGKPLVPLCGRPMVAHVVARALEAACFDEVIVATDDDRIAAAAAVAGARTVLTGPARSGSDRVAAAVRDLACDVVLNVQGDEPAMPAANLSGLTTFFSQRADAQMATLWLPASPEDLADPNVVKVVCDDEARALYFSRAPVPFPRFPQPGLARRHVGLYGYRREALFRFTSWPESELERSEGLEQLRALSHGMPIHVLPAAGDSVAVDRPEDVPRAEKAIMAMKREATAGAVRQQPRRAETDGAPR
jgi:3-deoxy-manno-octulosonate cytidylyltransferase (CMP-KDO synthetase)